MTRGLHQVFDEMLVLYAIDGRRDAFERLASRWRPRHYVHARRLLGRADLAADAVQDAWINIIRSLSRLKEPSRFPAWSYAIVTRRCQDSLRRTLRTNESELDETIADLSAANTDDVSDLQRGLKKLPREQQAAIALYYVDGFTVSEIAEALAIPEGTVKTRLFHARRMLRHYFDGDDHEQTR